MTLDNKLTYTINDIKAFATSLRKEQFVFDAWHRITGLRQPSQSELKAADIIEQLLIERESAERKLQMERKLKAIKDLCMSVPDCGVCLLSIGKTCPTKFWHDWTPDEIETAFNIIYGGEVDDGES